MSRRAFVCFNSFPVRTSLGKVLPLLFLLPPLGSSLHAAVKANSATRLRCMCHDIAKEGTVPWNIRKVSMILDLLSGGRKKSQENSGLDLCQPPSAHMLFTSVCLGFFICKNS